MIMPPPVPAKGFLDGLAARWKQARETAADKRRLIALLSDAVADCILTTDEVAQVSAWMSETGLTMKDLRADRVRIFDRAMSSLESNGCNLARIAGIEKIQSFLGVADFEVCKQKIRLAH